MKGQSEQQSNQERAGLYHEIKLRDQKLSTLRQQTSQLKESLEHQIEAREQARVVLSGLERKTQTLGIHMHFVRGFC